MIRSFAEWVFSNVCHQQAARTWAPGGVPLSLCERCTGVYVGAALLLCLLPWMRFRPSRRLAVLHAAFILQMAILGTHLIPHPASIRTLSGQLFITGVGYFVWNNLSADRKQASVPAPPWKYLLGVAGLVSTLQILVRVPLPLAASLLDLLALLGVVAILAASVLLSGGLLRRFPT